MLKNLLFGGILTAERDDTKERFDRNQTWPEGERGPA